MMSIIRYEPWGLLGQLGNELRRMSETRENAGEDSQIATSDWAPAVDIAEKDEAFIIYADIPGVKPEDIDVSMEHGMLTIRGERKDEKTVEEEGFKRVERARGSFYRRFSMPDTADPDRISARSNHGVLEVTIPKQEKVQPRRISVEH